MTTRDLIDRLKQYNAWRRDLDQPRYREYQPDPAQIGKDIDAAIAIIEKLPVTADGAIVVPGDDIWVWTLDDGLQPDKVADPKAEAWDYWPVSDAYYTREAAEAAARG